MSDAPEPPEDARALQAAFGASDAQLADLEAFRALLGEWNEKMNLVGPSAMASFWPRHVWDSAQLLLVEPRAKTWADLGAGAGFPGIVLAILLKETPGAHVHLIESLAKRCRFLDAVVGTLNLPATVHNARAEALSLKADVVTARAVAPLVRLLGYAQPYLKRGATGLFLKGQDVASELTEATRCWKFEHDLSPSRSSAEGQIVRVRGLVRVR
ncbi:MAG TPA: 16S rRNA (guanine(527)-N(7))-methyltransferase RsmG [Caulobacteraceae bacterium]|nr:16S rRNA (guanine(527)-N(7))-methyltransferase RsmG [Caulobacteraceae bacterium]